MLVLGVLECGAESDRFGRQPTQRPVMGFEWPGSRQHPLRRLLFAAESARSSGSECRMMCRRSIFERCLRIEKRRGGPFWLTGAHSVPPSREGNALAGLYVHGIVMSCRGGFRANGKRARIRTAPALPFCTWGSALGAGASVWLKGQGTADAPAINR